MLKHNLLVYSSDGARASRPPSRERRARRLPRRESPPPFHACSPKCRSTMPNMSVSSSGPGGNSVGSEASSTVRCERSIAGVAVRAFHQRGIERDALRGRIEEQLHRIVARLAVDIDRAGELRRPIVGEPPVIRLPALRRRRSESPRRCGVFELVAAALRADQHFGDALLARGTRRPPAGRAASSPSATKTCENW